MAQEHDMNETKRLMNSPGAIERLLRIAVRPEPVPVNVTDVGKGHLVTSFQDIGSREEQQDRVAVFNVRQSADRNLHRVFKKIHAGLASALTEEEMDSGGAVASLALVDPGKQITIANLGDSRFSLAITTQDINRPRYLRLTKDDVPSIASERKRILKAGGEIDQDGRLVVNGRSLAVSAAFGDKRYDPFIRRTPHVHHYNINDPRLKIAKDAQIVLFGESDGSHLSRPGYGRINSLASALNDKGRFDLTMMATEFNEVALRNERYVQRNFLKALTDKQRALLKMILDGDEPEESDETEIEDISIAYEYFNIRRDNISFVASEIKGSKTKHEIPAYGMLIVDSHGKTGDAIADMVVDLFRQELS